MRDRSEIGIKRVDRNNIETLERLGWRRPSIGARRTLGRAHEYT
jgi:hypothetical protein